MTADRWSSGQDNDQKSGLTEILARLATRTDIQDMGEQLRRHMDIVFGRVREDIRRLDERVLALLAERNTPDGASRLLKRPQ